MKFEGHLILALASNFHTGTFGYCSCEIQPAFIHQTRFKLSNISTIIIILSNGLETKCYSNPAIPNSANLGQRQLQCSEISEH